VIGSEGIHTAGYGFALTPVGINSVALVLVALLFRHVVASRPAAAPRPPAPPPVRLHDSDIDAAIADMHTSFDISRDDLDTLLRHAERHAATRVKP